MTVQNMIEKLMRMFPEASEQFIVKEVDVAQRRFCDATNLLTEVGDLSNITSYISFSMPSDFKSLMGVYYYDSDDNPVYGEDLTIAAEVHTVSDTKKLTFRSTNLTPITEIPTSISSIQIEYYKYPTAISNRYSTLSIGEEYWAALEKMVMIELFKMYPRAVNVGGAVYESVDWKGIAILEKEVRAYELKAKAEKNIAYDDRMYEIIPCDYAGDRYRTLRSKVSGTTIAIEGGDVSYAKLIRIIVDDNTDTYASYYNVEEKSGFGTINVAVDTGVPSITVTSPSNEFTADPATWVFSNQGMRYSYDNAGQITFTPWSESWGTVEIVIYIYE